MSWQGAERNQKSEVGGQGSARIEVGGAALRASRFEAKRNDAETGREWRADNFELGTANCESWIVIL